MKKKVWITGLFILFMLGIILSYRFFMKNDYEAISYTDFIQQVEEHKVDTVLIKNDEIIIATLLDGSLYEVPNPMKENFKEYLLLQNIKVQSKASADLSGFSSIIFILIIAGVVIYFSKGQNDNKELINDVNKNGISNEKLVKFENVAGNDEAKEMVSDIVKFIQNPDKYNAKGAKMPRGILLYGLPGTGKTLLAKAIAGEANVPFFAMSGSDFVQMYVGVGANRVRKLFKKARKSQKAVIFIDEIDALGKSRTGNSNGANDEREQTLNALLTEMSGFHSREGIVVVGATNRVDTLDAALLRPGRFDRHIEVKLPDQQAREAIIKLYFKDKPMAEDADAKELALQTVMFSGAMLEHLINEAAIIAANLNEEFITNAHLNKALYIVVAGMEKKNKEAYMGQEEKAITAYHEAGHALIARLLLPDTTVAKVSIIPTTKGAAGYNYNIPKDKLYQKKYEILGHIKMLLAGRAAEAIEFGEDAVTTGAMNDIKEASKELYNYFSKFGMDEGNGLFFLETNTLDEKIYDNCRKMMKQLYEETQNLLITYRNELDEIVELLIERETITGEEMDIVLENKKIS